MPGRNVLELRRYVTASRVNPINSCQKAEGSAFFFSSFVLAEANARSECPGMAQKETGLLRLKMAFFKIDYFTSRMKSTDCYYDIFSTKSGPAIKPLLAATCFYSINHFLGFSYFII